MQLSEREIMQSFAFKKEINNNSSAHSTLSETMSLDENHLLLSYHTDFEGKDLNLLKKSVRKVNPTFSNEPKFMKDVQMVVDENYINYMLFNLFETDKQYSITEYIFSMWPDAWLGGPQAIRAFMSVQIWSLFFPELLKEYKA